MTSILSLELGKFKSVAAHWGVARETVWRWRRVLGVTEYTP